MLAKIRFPTTMSGSRSQWFYPLDETTLRFTLKKQANSRLEPIGRHHCAVDVSECIRWSCTCSTCVLNRSRRSELEIRRHLISRKELSWRTRNPSSSVHLGVDRGEVSSEERLPVPFTVTRTLPHFQSKLYSSTMFASLSFIQFGLYWIQIDIISSQTFRRGIEPTNGQPTGEIKRLSCERRGGKMKGMELNWHVRGLFRKS